MKRWPWIVAGLAGIGAAFAFLSGQGRAQVARRRARLLDAIRSGVDPGMFDPGMQVPPAPAPDVGLTPRDVRSPPARVELDPVRPQNLSTEELRAFYGSIDTDTLVALYWRTQSSPEAQEAHEAGHAYEPLALMELELQDRGIDSRDL